ncbi:MAG: DsbA family oxidoreductase [Rhodospirillaceae bacterium]
MLIDVFSDLVCPWCYIGIHRLGRALKERPRLQARRRWHPFLLSPDLPAGGIDRALYLTIRFGSRQRARQMLAVVEDTALRDGLPLNLQRITRTPNTLDAHRLVLLAETIGASDTLIETLFAAYFVDGLDIGDRDLLLVLAAAAGIDPDQARACLARDGYPELTRFQAEVLGHQLDLHAVPCFIFERRFVLAGAQEPVAFLPLLDLAAGDAGMAA